MKEMHSHPANQNNIIWGERLTEGDLVKKGDYFASVSGTWQELTSLGHIIQKEDSTYWVRMQ